MIGNKLKLLRNEKKETIRKAAKGIGIRESMLSAYESGKWMPDNDVLEKIAEYYGVSAAAVLKESYGDDTVLHGGNERFCPLKVKEVRHPKTGDTTKWFLPCLKEKCMAYGTGGSCRMFSKNR